MALGNHPIVVHVGPHAVESRSVQHERCFGCGYYELDAVTSEFLEIQAAIVAMRDVTKPNPIAVKFARKVMGLSQTALAAKLGLTQETISRYETGALSISPEYRLALAGLLTGEEQRVRGSGDAAPRLMPTGTE